MIAFFSWASVGRVVRGQTLSLREREYVEAARSLGAGDLRIMFVDILPNLIAQVIVYLTLLIPSAVVFEATLSFLGLGVVPPTATWGNMLSESLGYYRVAWWFVLFPGAALLITTLAFNLLGDSVRDAFDHHTARELNAAPEHGRDALGDRHGPLRPFEARAHQQELVATDAPDDVVGAQQLLEPAGDVDEQLVSGAVSEGVVDRLELVEIDEDDRGRKPVGSRERARWPS